MNIRIVPILAAALLALVALAGCGGSLTTADKTTWPTVTTETITVPAPEPPPLDLDAIADEAFIQTIEQEGIPYPSVDELLATADAACTALLDGDVFDAMAVFEADGYGEHAAYMSGAMLVLCTGGDW